MAVGKIRCYSQRARWLMLNMNSLVLATRHFVTSHQSPSQNVNVRHPPYGRNSMQNSIPPSFTSTRMQCSKFIARKNIESSRKNTSSMEIQTASPKRLMQWHIICIHRIAFEMQIKIRPSDRDDHSPSSSARSSSSPQRFSTQ